MRKAILLVTMVAAAFVVARAADAQVYPPPSFPPSVSVLATLPLPGASVVPTVPAVTNTSATLPGRVAAADPATTALAAPTTVAAVAGVNQNRGTAAVGSAGQTRPVAFTGARSSYHVQLAVGLIFGGLMLVVAAKRRRPRRGLA